MVRNSLKYVSWKDYKALTADLKRVYRSVTEDEALLNSVIRKALKRERYFQMTMLQQKWFILRSKMPVKNGRCPFKIGARR